ncbi:MAG: hypothetical protein MR654_05350 [Corynebacterium glucuronolyticum]|nr:hypothetical protein [Corynebacterium glucuronolyticum]
MHTRWPTVRSPGPYTAVAWYVLAMRGLIESAAAWSRRMYATSVSKENGVSGPGRPGICHRATTPSLSSCDEPAGCQNTSDCPTSAQ